MAIIALAMGVAAPRIGAGLGRLELNRAVTAIHDFVKIARIEAQRSDQAQYVVFDARAGRMAVVSPDLSVKRVQSLPSSVQFIMERAELSATAVVAPSGIVRGEPIRLRWRAGEVTVSLP